jgi:hypothetical protein
MLGLLSAEEYFPTEWEMTLLDMLYDGYDQKEIAALTGEDYEYVRKSITLLKVKIGANTTEELTGKYGGYKERKKHEQKNGHSLICALCLEKM